MKIYLAVLTLVVLLLLGGVSILTLDYIDLVQEINYDNDIDNQNNQMLQSEIEALQKHFKSPVL